MKEKSLLEQKGIGYTEYNGVLIPNVVISKHRNYHIARFGVMHKKWLKKTIRAFIRLTI